MLRIANASGFWGDRLGAVEEMVRGGPIDVLTGDYLAELSMAILHKSRLKDPRAGFVPTFLRQLEGVLGECLDKKIRVVTNAGGLNPRGLAEAIDRLAQKLGLHPRVAYVEGDDLTARLDELARAGEPLAHLDHGTPLESAPGEVLTANAYLGGWGIREALARGADLVVCPRVTDAALAVGPSAWRFDWRRDDWDRLAGAVAAGHILECGAQATGGNYAFFDEVRDWRRLGFPIAEMHEDGSFVITKHPNTGGLVNAGTVTAQLLYEIQGARYANPDVVARFDSLRLVEEGPDRVRVEGARGEPAPRTAKVAINYAGGFRNSMTILLGGLDLERKARIVEEMLFDELGGKAQYAAVDVRLQRMDREHPRSNEEALAYLRVTVMSPDAELVGRRFASRVVELALSTVPGFSSRTPPGDAQPYLVYWPALVDARQLRERVIFEGETIAIAPAPGGSTEDAPAIAPPSIALPPPPSGETVRVPLGRAFGARSGDKGGNANLGVWARTPAAFAFLREWLTVERLKSLLPDVAPFPIERDDLPNLLALNFYIRGLLGEGVASSARSDPQAKTLGEYFRAVHADLPRAIL
ncbi:MAG TPA: acyclic terpene utilization AtuA family protein [Polyangia bacterium]|nr:acyclic terpene utilization AtuA family protein [Polyangia bacterium]